MTQLEKARDTTDLRMVAIALLLAGGSVFCLAGCEDQGPAEEMGESIDEAAEEAGDDMEEATDG
ncbi:hypothetical protein [Algiphilus sp.]|uniref:hypothetical protein n=1 Tax=Algiphilus sp. TaxID=1872431 RepID=UPI003C679080